MTFYYRRSFRARPRHIESGYQMEVISYLRRFYPGTLFTISPIVKLSKGMAVKMVRLGYTAGTPDIMIFEARKGLHGLFIEMKAPKTETNAPGSATESQKIFQAEAIKRGYFYIFCFGAEEAKKAIDDYLKTT